MLLSTFLLPALTVASATCPPKNFAGPPALGACISQIPNPIEPRTPPLEPTPEPEALPSEQNLLDSPAPPSSEADDVRQVPGTIVVERFLFTGDYTAFTDEELAEAVSDLTDRSISFAELLSVEAKLTQLYIDAGYINSGAVVPTGQTLDPESSMVEVRIVEGGLEELQIVGESRLDESYIRQRLRRATNPPLNQAELLEALQLLQLDPRIETISAELSAGPQPNLSFLDVTVTEANTFSLDAFIDNGRSPSVGSVRRGFGLSEANLFGIGDRIELDYINTKGSNTFEGLYAVPFNSLNGTIFVSGGFTNTSIVEAPFDQIDITGDSFFIEAGLRQPLYRTPTEEFALGLSFSRQQSRTELFDIGFPLSVGADEDGETRISALRFSQEWTRRNARQVLALRSRFSLGIDAFDATLNDNAPDSEFFAWQGQAQYVRALAPETLLVLRSNLQLATDSLVPLEQSPLGGLGSVRGYRQDTLLTDNSFFTSAEVQLPIARFRRVDGLLQVAPFADLGLGWNNSGTLDPDPDTLFGLGVGLQLQLGDRFSARFDVGFPLSDLDDGDETLQEDGLYFTVRFSPF